jgi:FAD/FMN-containing dehydrogenase
MMRLRRLFGLSKDTITAFRDILGERGVKTDDIEKYTKDWQGLYGGDGSVVLFPRTSEQVSKVMKICYKNKIPIVPQSGNTSLVAGGIPIKNEVVLSLEKMNKIGEFDKNNGVIDVESGVILQNLQEVLAKEGYATPYDLGSRGSCMVGGNISTMACGIHFVKYGNLRNYVLGLEVVTPNGDILDMMTHIRKDNTGPDLKQLFIGSEGTLGIITKASILCVKKDKFKKVLFIKVNGYQNVLEIHKEAKAHFKSSLCAIEYLDLESYYLVEQAQKSLKFPYKSSDCHDNHYFVLVENGGEDEAQVEESLYAFSEKIEPLAEDILVCKNKADERNFWEIREAVAPSCSNAGDVLKYDFSLDIAKIEEFVTYTRNLMGDKASKVTGYAHIGDGNLHMNIVVNPKYDWKKVQKEFEPSIINYVVEHRGSISAEHGIGSCKTQYLNQQKSDSVYKSMYLLKKQFDPFNILNPGKVFGAYATE